MVMDSFWLKISIFGVLVIGAMILVVTFVDSGGLEDDNESFYEVTQRDDERLRADPEFVEPAETETAEVKPQRPEVQPAEEIVKPKPQFRELSEIEETEAEKLFEVAIQNRKIARLPGPSFKAKRMLADIPEHYRERYKITDEEIDLGDYK